MLFNQIDEAYCVDMQTLSSDMRDLVRFDEVMVKLDMTSGAILSRNKKSTGMGIGQWKGRQHWPEEVRWMKVLSEMKIFGFLICPTNKETLTNTWNKVVEGFEKVLFSWQSRLLDTLIQRVEVAKVFALSKLFYVAQVLPLPDKHRRRVESSLSKFIFNGRHERLRLSELENSPRQGGLGLPDIGVKADSLLLKQMCRMMTLDTEGSFHLLGYWLSGFLSNTGLGENFPELADLGPVSHTMSKVYPLHQYMHDTFMEGVGRGEVKKGTLKAVTTKKIYKSRIDDMLTSPKVESKFP